MGGECWSKPQFVQSHLHNPFNRYREMAEEKDKDFVETVVKMLVDNPDDVKVARKIDEMGVLITLDVNAADMGMVIGREGATAKALRTLLRVIGARNSARVNLKINEPEGSTRGLAARDAVNKPQADKKSLDEVVGDIKV